MEGGRRTSDRDGSHHSSHHSHSHHHHDSHSQQHDRQLTGEHRRTGEHSTAATAAGGQAGPVGESAPQQHDYSSNSSLGGWNTGLLLRRLRAGMQQQYESFRQKADCQPSSSLEKGGWGSFGRGSLSSNAAAAAAVAAGEGYSRRCSTSGSSFSSTSSFTLKQEAAAAFAAAAAADALRPCHVLPEVWADEDGWAPWPSKDSHSAVGILPLLLSGSGSNSSGQALTTAAVAAVAGQWEDNETDFTWQEFLSTVAAINYPSLVRQQQQLLLQQELQRVAADAAAAAPRAAGVQTAAVGGGSAKAAACLGPIAEGLEDTDAAADRAASPQPNAAPAVVFSSPADVGRLSFRCESGQVTARPLPAASGGRASHEQLQRPSSAAAGAAAASGGGSGSRVRSPVQHKLALDDLDKELASLGLAPTAAAGGAEPTTPSCFSERTSGGSDADTHAYASRPHHAREAASQQGSAAGSAVADVEAGTGAESAHEAAAVAAPESPAKPPKDNTRRVTLFTESMRHRGECPAPPR